MLEYSFLYLYISFFFFFFNDTATTEIYTLSLHDALPIGSRPAARTWSPAQITSCRIAIRSEEHTSELQSRQYLVCRLLLEKKKREQEDIARADRDQQVPFAKAPADRVNRPVAVRQPPHVLPFVAIFVFNDTATTEISTLSLHDALPI